MHRTLVFGNSGSGKSTLAKRLAERHGVAHLDLDEVAWKSPGVRDEVAASVARVRAFFDEHEQWVIEGCYGSLLERLAVEARELVFLNPGTPACIANCRARPWEAHKYPSEEAQDANLAMLLEWVGGYDARSDEFGLAEHRRIFDAFEGPKR